MYGTTSRTSRRGPAWGWLYAILPLAFAVFALVEALEVSGTARIVLQLLATLVVFAAMAVWVRANRTALDVTGARRVPGERRPLDPSLSSEADGVEMFGGAGHRLGQRDRVASDPYARRTR